jgi:hypothetical protein
MGLKQMQNAVSPSGVGLPLYVVDRTSEMGCSGDQGGKRLTIAW